MSRVEGRDVLRFLGEEEEAAILLLLLLVGIVLATPKGRPVSADKERKNRQKKADYSFAS
jgi:hypothetical protein